MDNNVIRRKNAKNGSDSVMKTASLKPTPIGALKPLDDNPRTMSRAAMKKLMESIQRDPEFMMLRHIVHDRDGVILGGNQRFRACKRLGMKALPPGWTVLADNLSDEQRKRFILMDNSPDGASGEWSDDVLKSVFGEEVLKDVGLFREAIVEPPVPKLKDMSEKSEKLKKFIESRKSSRRILGDRNDVSFWLCVVFQSYEQKHEFLSKIGNPRTRYGMYLDGEELAKAVGVEMKEVDIPPAHVRINKKLSEMVMK